MWVPVTLECSESAQQLIAHSDHNERCQKKNAIFGISGFEMFPDFEQAIAFLKERISPS